MGGKSGIGGRATLVLFAVLACALAGSGSARAAVESCPHACSWTDGTKPRDVIGAVRDALVDKRSGLSEPRARAWIDNANLAIGWTLESHRWTATGGFRQTFAGAGGLLGLRVAAGRLVWARSAVAAATQPELRGLVAAMSRVVELRLDDVAAAGSDASVVSRARYDYDQGNADFASDPMHASYSYLQAWNRLVGLEPLDPVELPPSVLPDESIVPAASSGSSGGEPGAGGSGSGSSGGSSAGAPPRTAAIRISALPTVGLLGKAVPLQYRVRGDRETREEIWVRKGGRVVARATTGFAHRAGRVVAVRLRPRAAIGRLSFCVRAFDRNGDVTATSCATLELRFAVRTFTARGIAGQPVQLRYRVALARPTSAVVAIMDGKRRLQTLRLGRTRGSAKSIVWKAPKRFAGKRLAFCVIARAAAGERSVRSCASVQLGRP